MSMRVLVIKSEDAVLQTLKTVLDRSGFNVFALNSGDEALDFLDIYEYDIIIMDTNLSDICGIELLKKLRLNKVSAPVIMISLNSDIDVKVAAFTAGADDFIVKPFHTDELVARIYAVIRRSRGYSNSVIRIGSILLNLNSKKVEINGTPIHLTGKEYAILELLSLRKGRTFSRGMLLNHLYDGLQEPEPKIIDVFIYRLRKKMMKACNGFSHIENVWGSGYVLREDDVSTIPLEEISFVSSSDVSSSDVSAVSAATL